LNRPAIQTGDWQEREKGSRQESIRGLCGDNSGLPENAPHLWKAKEDSGGGAVDGQTETGFYGNGRRGGVRNPPSKSRGGVVGGPPPPGAFFGSHKTMDVELLGSGLVLKIQGGGGGLAPGSPPT